MAERPAADRLPIKLILPKQGKERPVRGGGGKKPPFRPVTRAYRQSLARQIEAIREATRTEMTAVAAAPVRVKVLPKAVAKSHRPEALFSPRTCPIVGGGRLGELFVKATPAGLNALTELIEAGDSDVLVKEISSIETIEAVTPTYRRKGLEATDVLRKSPRGKDGIGRVCIVLSGVRIARNSNRDTHFGAL
jgi:serine protease AprX